MAVSDWRSEIAQTAVNHQAMDLCDCRGDAARRQARDIQLRGQMRLWLDRGSDEGIGRVLAQEAPDLGRDVLGAHRARN